MYVTRLSRVHELQRSVSIIPTSNLNAYHPKFSRKFSQNFVLFHRRYMHFMAGVDHQSGYPLLIHKICEAFRLCIPQENSYIILHSGKSIIEKRRENNVNKEQRKKNRNRNKFEIIGEDFDEAKRQFNHQPNVAISPAFKRSFSFLQAIGVTHVTQWEGEFSSERKMLQYLRQMKYIRMRGGFIYHSDVDEFPDRGMFLQAMAELRSGVCNSIV